MLHLLSTFYPLHREPMVRLLCARKQWTPAVRACMQSLLPPPHILEQPEE